MFPIFFCCPSRRPRPPPDYPFTNLISTVRQIREMREKGEDTEALCGEANTKKIRAPYTARPKGVDLANTQKK